MAWRPSLRPLCNSVRSDGGAVSGMREGAAWDAANVQTVSRVGWRKGGAMREPAGAAGQAGAGREGSSRRRPEAGATQQRVGMRL